MFAGITGGSVGELARARGPASRGPWRAFVAAGDEVGAVETAVDVLLGRAVVDGRADGGFPRVGSVRGVVAAGVAGEIDERAAGVLGGRPGVDRGRSGRCPLRATRRCPPARTRTNLRRLPETKLTPPPSPAPASPLTRRRFSSVSVSTDDTIMSSSGPRPTPTERCRRRQINTVVSVAWSSRSPGRPGGALSRAERRNPAY